VYDQLEEASTHKSAKTHVSNVFVTRDLDLWLYDPKINTLTRLIYDHFYVKFGDPSCIGFWDCAEKQTDTQTTTTPATAGGVDNEWPQYRVNMQLHKRDREKSHGDAVTVWQVNVMYDGHQLRSTHTAAIMAKASPRDNSWMPP